MKKEPPKPALPFKVGDTVYDTWNQEYTVTQLDPAANFGLGAIRIKRKKDGFLTAQAFGAHDLTLTRKTTNQSPSSTGVTAL